MEWHNFLNGGDNTAMTLSAAGILSVDETGVGAAAQVDLFDDYDDALMLKMGVQERNHDLLVEMGVFSQKEDGRYMMNIQPMTRLLAGGIYQNRAMIDRLERELAEIKRG
jgi:hypothetical protein